MTNMVFITFNLPVLTKPYFSSPAFGHPKMNFNIFKISNACCQIMVLWYCVYLYLYFDIKIRIFYFILLYSILFYFILFLFKKKHTKTCSSYQLDNLVKSKVKHNFHCFSFVKNRASIWVVIFH